MCFSCDEKMHYCYLLLIFGIIINFSQAASYSGLGVKGSGPHVNQSWGQPWPMPHFMKTYDQDFMVVRPSLFKFKVTNYTCDIVEEAVKRYYSILLKGRITKNGQTQYSNFILPLGQTEGYRGHLDVLEVTLTSPCQFMPHDAMDESYKLRIDTPASPKKATLVAKTNWGILRGLETFSQLVHHSPDHSSLRIRSLAIHDVPRFSFRSILLDTSRHFLPKKILLENLDIMAMNKFNVFHWHLTDDPSFPYQSKKFPELSENGAYHSYTHVYTAKDIADVLEYARMRGIRIVPEFDTPGHTQSWFSIPNLLTPCYTPNHSFPDGTFGPINPIISENYKFLKDFFAEIMKTFPDKYLHLGGDEVDFSCWESNPDIRQFMAARNWTDYSKLEAMYIKRLSDIISSFPEKKSTIVWQEVVDNGVKVSNETVVNVWKGGHFQDELANVTNRGYRAILYSCWYLDVISWTIDWPGYYKCEPQNFTGTSVQKNLVLGGGAALWGEFVDSSNVISRLWPRASAPSERLWSPENTIDLEDAARRIEEHRCRLLQRGFQVQPPNGPGYCPIEWE